MTSATSIEYAHLRTSDELVGEWGDLTGSCAGFSVAAAQEILHHGELQSSFLEKRAIFYWERLLVLSLYQIVPKGVSLEEIKRGISPEMDSLIAQGLKKYIQNLEKESSLKVIESHPANILGSLRTSFLTTALSFFQKETLPPFFIIFHQKGNSLTHHHVIYVYPERGLIADYKFKDLLKLDPDNFRIEFQKYLDTHYKNKKAQILVTSSKTLHPQWTPFFLKKILLYGETALRIAIHEGVVSGVKYLIPHRAKRERIPPEQNGRQINEIALQEALCQTTKAILETTEAALPQRIEKLQEYLRENREQVMSLIAKGQWQNLFPQGDFISTSLPTTEIEKDQIRKKIFEMLHQFDPEFRVIADHLHRLLLYCD